MQIWVLPQVGVQEKYSKLQEVSNTLERNLPLAVINEKQNPPRLEKEGRLDTKYINRNRLSPIFSLPYVSKEWVIDYYLKRRDFNPKTVAGVLDSVGIEIKGDKHFNSQKISLIALGITLFYDTLCLLNLSGNFYDSDAREIANILTKKLNLSNTDSNFSFGVTDDELIALAGEFSRRGYEIAMTTLDIEKVQLKFRSIRDLFNREVMQRIDSIYSIKKRIANGKWKALAFYSPIHSFYLYLTKAKKSNFRIQFSQENITPVNLETVFEELSSAVATIKSIHT